MCGYINQHQGAAYVVHKYTHTHTYIWISENLSPQISITLHFVSSHHSRMSRL